MKVKKLIKILQNHDPDSLVILSSDAEGNSFSEATDVESFYFDEDNSEILSKKDAIECGGTVYFKKCVTIWP